MLQIFIEHRQDVITRRTIFDLGKAKERAHILEGLQIALENVDEVIAIIKASRITSYNVCYTKLLRICQNLK